MNENSVGFAGDDVSASSGNVVAAPATVSLAATVGKTNFVTGFDVTGAGATDSVTVVYVGQHTDLTANTGSTDIAIDSPYWNELLQIALELWKIEILGKGDAQ